MIPEIPIESFSVFAAGVDHSECVAFDKKGTLWAGGEAGQIYKISAQGLPQLVVNVGGFCAGLAFSPSDDLLVCAPHAGIVRVQTGGSHSIFATHAGNHKLVCPNFGLFDSAGNYYVTDSGNFRKKNGFLIRFSSDGRGEVLGGPFGYANGLAMSVDGKSLFMVESDTNSVLRFEIGGGGSVSGPAVFATECGRFPDGLAMLTNGDLLVCCYASDEIWRITPSGAKTLFAWDPWAILLGSPTNMAFGGQNRDEIYVANLARTTITRARVPYQGCCNRNQTKNP